MREPRVGDYIRPDGWKIGEVLDQGDPALCGWAGCAFRVKAGWVPDPTEAQPHRWVNLYHLAVNVTVTGQVEQDEGYRCRVEFVGDDTDPSTFCGGWVKLTD